MVVLGWNWGSGNCCCTRCTHGILRLASSPLRARSTKGLDSSVQLIPLRDQQRDDVFGWHNFGS
jgi:hypothetical protein